MQADGSCCSLVTHTPGSTSQSPCPALSEADPTLSKSQNMSLVYDSVIYHSCQSLVSPSVGPLKQACQLFHCPGPPHDLGSRSTQGPEVEMLPNIPSTRDDTNRFGSFVAWTGNLSQ